MLNLEGEKKRASSLNLFTFAAVIHISILQRRPERRQRRLIFAYQQLRKKSAIVRFSDSQLNPSDTLCIPTWPLLSFFLLFVFVFVVEYPFSSCCCCFL